MKLRAAADCFNENAFALLSWFPNLLNRLSAWLFEHSANFICRSVDPSLWNTPPFNVFECERRLHPWWYWFKQLIFDYHILEVSAFLLFLFFCIGVAAAIYCLDETRCIRHSDWRSLRLLRAWIFNIRVTGWCFRPAQPGGTDEGVVWSTTTHGISVTRGTAVDTVDPLPVVNGNYLLARWLPFRIRTTRSGYDVFYELTPIWFSWEAARGDEFHNGFCVRKELNGSLLLVHVSPLSTHTTASISTTEWDTLMAAFNTSGNKATPYSAGTIHGRFEPTDNKKTLTMTQSIISDYWNANMARKAIGPQMAIRTALQFVGDTRDDELADYKTTGRRIAPDFVEEPDAMPAIGRQASLSAVHFRLDAFRNTMVAAERDSIIEYAREFVAHLTPANEIEPWSEQQVLDSQTKPLQRLRNEREKWWHRITKNLQVKAMCKVEPVSNSGPIRNISTCEVSFNLELGRYMLAAAEYLKANTTWYCAGKTPRATADRVVEIVNKARRRQGVREVCCADVSKMDAGKNPYLTAHLTTSLYISLFGIEEAELVQLRTDEARATAVTNENEKYLVAASQLSGSCTTTIDNTVTNAFISYYAYRLEGLSADVAYEYLGAYVGDDSVSNNSAASVELAGKHLGYTIKAEMISEYEPVPFLSRYFYDCWVGGPHSIQDPMRLMSKIHLSIAPPTYPTEQAAVDKLKGLMELDKGVSLYRELFTHVSRLTGRSAKRNYDIGWMQEQAANGGGWPTDASADEWWEEFTRVSPSAYSKWLSQLRTFDEFLMGAPVLIPKERKEKTTTTVDPAEPSAIVPPGVGTDPAPDFSTIIEVATETTEALHEVVENTATMINEVAAEYTIELKKNTLALRRAREAREALCRQGPHDESTPTLPRSLSPALSTQSLPTGRKKRKSRATRATPSQAFPIGTWVPGALR